MSLNEIAVFARVVAAGSFSGAARQLGTPKSTVSRAVTRLEERLGVRLLQRSTRTLNLTDAGAGFYEQVAEAIGMIEAAESAVTEHQEEPTGTLRITAPYDFGSGVLADLLPRFTSRYTGLQVEVSLTGRLVDLISEGFDVALRAGPMRDSTLVARKLGEMESRLFASPAYLDARGTPTSPEQLKSHDCVLFRPRSGKLRWRLCGPDGAVEVDVRGAISADEYSFVRAAVRAGAGIGLLPWFLCAGDQQEGHLVRVLPDYERRGGRIHLVYPSTLHLPRKVEVFRDFLVDELSRAPWLTAPD
ncbi:MAG: LysR family transcriptional regulator [Haliangiales bacterium]